MTSILSYFPPVPIDMAQQPPALAQNIDTADAAARQHVAREMEGLFASLLLKEMRETIGGEGLFSGDASDVYGGLFDLYLGRHLAQQSALGIGQLIRQYFEASTIS